MILSVAAGLVLLLVLSNVLFWPRILRTSSETPPDVSVLIPARNEAANIAQCIEAVLRDGAAVLEILTYDDHSTDGTAELVRGVGLQDTRVGLIGTQPLPENWCGKTFACHQLSQAARGHWLLFLDADTRVAEGAIAGMRTAAAAQRASFLSCWPGLETNSLAEDILMPQLNSIVFTMFPALLSLASQRASLGVAHGACLLIRADTYRNVGGHAAVRDEIFEDTRLAQLWRANSERSICLDGQDVVRVRMYTGLAAIWSGFEKNFYPAFRREVTFWLFLLFRFAIFLLPFLLLNWTAMSIVLLIRLLLAWRFAQPWWSVLAQPFAEAATLLLGLSSWWRCHSGRGVTWKGRMYRARRV